MPRKCNCSGSCVPMSVSENVGDRPDASPDVSGVTRRDFIALAGIGATGALWAGSAREAQARSMTLQSAEELAAWKRALFQPSAPNRYRSETHTDARMPLGGIGTGNFEIGADGQFTTWQLFNTLSDGQIPLFFGIKAGENSRMLQTYGGPNGIPRVKSIEMTGDYPIATLRYHDTDIPVQVEMSAFTPFAPLDAAFSALPVACFIFRIHNPTAQPIPVTLGGFMQNPVGYDALGPSIGPDARHPNYGGNINEALPLKNGVALAMRAQPAAEMKADAPLHILTNLPPGAFHTPYEGRPASISVDGLDRLPSLGDAAHTLIWLEDAPVDLPISTLRAAVSAVRSGATLVFSGVAMPLLKHYGEITGGKPLDAGALRPDIVYEDFEGGYEKWTVVGTAFGTAPAHGTLPNQQMVSNFVGHGLVNSYLGGDDTTGKLISRDFTVERSFIRFLVGGGSGPNTQIRLLVNGKVVRATSGRNEEKLLPAYWNVQQFLGQTAHIEIVDEQQGGWGHINVDEIEFSDMPTSPETLALLDEILPARFSGIRAAAGSNGARPLVEYLDRTLRDNVHEESLSDGQALLTRALDAGRVILADRPILPPEYVETLGARHAAYRSLALMAGIRIEGEAGVPARAPGFGTLTLGALGNTTGHYVSCGDWTTAWGTFAGMQGPRPGSATTLTSPSPIGETHNGAVFAEMVVPAGGTVEAPFFLAWSYPNKYNGDVWMGNHYCQAWPDATTVARHVAESFPTLRARTERFRSVFYDSTLPWWLLDCVTSQVATLRHIGVVFRIANGDVYGWEGSNGCCDPTCTHVWGYVQNMARVFPELERDMRRIDYKHQQNGNGGVNNRTAVPSPPQPSGEHPFTDGHCSTVLKAYREALNTPNDRWLREYWPNIKRSVEYLIARDAATSNGVPNGLLEDDQWNTYDEALHGVSGFIGAYYLAALRAGEEMAKRMGDAATAERFHGVFLTGQKNLIARCWNGEYLQQNLPGYEQMGGEVGPGCMADQLIGQWWAHQLGLGYLLPKEMVQTALRSVFKYNWMPDLTGWKHSPRAFAGAKDRGLIICTWPKGGRPPRVMLYSDEVWTGIEYQVAGHMLYEGLIEEGYSIVKGARDRYNGIPKAPIPRSPWNEIECGGHYARAGASWSLLLALSGWLHDGITGAVTFKPLHTPEAFKSFFAGAEGWGSLSQHRKGNVQTSEIHVVEGKLAVTQLHLHSPAPTSHATVKIDGRQVPATLKQTSDGVSIALSRPMVVGAGQRLTVAI